VDAPLFLRLNRRHRYPNETVRAGTWRRVLRANLVSDDAASATASILAGIPSTPVEDRKRSNCYFGHNGVPKVMRGDWGETTQPMPDWWKIRVPEKEDAYPELPPFGPTPSHGFLLRHWRWQRQGRATSLSTR
jgi:hypothetical protein